VGSSLELIDRGSGDLDKEPVKPRTPSAVGGVTPMTAPSQKNPCSHQYRLNIQRQGFTRVRTDTAKSLDSKQGAQELRQMSVGIP